MRCLVTGGSGFIGARVISQLLERQHEVIALVRDKNNLSRLQPYANRIKLIETSLDDTAPLSNLLPENSIDSCIHLAWYAEPGKYLESQNNLGLVQQSLDLLQSVAQLGCKRFVGAGTCAEYETSAGLLKENGLVAPTTLYGSAKLALRYMGEQRPDSLVSALLGVEFSMSMVHMKTNDALFLQLSIVFWTARHSEHPRANRSEISSMSMTWQAVLFVLQNRPNRACLTWQQTIPSP